MFAFTSHYMNIFLNPLQGHSWIFWLCLLYLTSVAWRETETQTIAPSKLLIMPVGLLIMKFHLFSFHIGLSFIFLIWLGLWTLIGYWISRHTKMEVESFKETRFVKIQGSPYPIKILLGLCVMQYSLELLAQVYPRFAAGLILADYLLALLCIGYFFGRLLWAYHKIRNQNSSPTKPGHF
jgi:hypothetical protein